MPDRSNSSKSTAPSRLAAKAPAAAAGFPEGADRAGSVTADAPGYSCAICGTKVPARAGADADAAASAAAHRYRPFCSARCQRIDLGNWLDERYVVPGGPAVSDKADDAAAEEG